MDRHKQKLTNLLDKEVRLLQKKILDLAEVIIPTDNFKPFRAKILGATNDLFRNIQSELDKNYELKYTPQIICEDLVEINSSKNTDK